MSTDLIDRAARLLAAARRPLHLTGAGMSAESGIPTFRDAGGYWRRFPPFARLGLAAEELASPWAFYEWLIPPEDGKLGESS